MGLMESLSTTDVAKKQEDRMSSWVQYINFLLQERKNIEQKLDKMGKAELVAFDRQIIEACQQSLKGFDAWFTDFSIMEKMDRELVREIAKNLLRIGFSLLEYDRDVTKLWQDTQLVEWQKKAEAESKKGGNDILI
jgi:hypothetical protein